jgi:hypothetical protein
MPRWKLKRLRDEYLTEINRLWQPVQNIHTLHMVSKEKREDIKRLYKAYVPRRG